MNEVAIIKVQGLGKEFPGVVALKDVNLEIKRNTVHCIVGENGAGKSTFIKILTGALPRTVGSILLDGKAFEPKKVREAMAGGISVLYQELNVVDDLTVAENLTLGKEEHRFGFIRRGESLGRAGRVLKDFDETIQPETRVGDLSVAQKQVVEIAKALSAECSVLVMDEPTAALSEEETRRLFKIVEKLKTEGITVIYISHKLNEIFQIGDYVSVFRDGLLVGTEPVSEITTTDLVKMMTGKVVTETYVPSNTDYSRKLLEARGVSSDFLKDIGFELYKGEILGFYGLVGAGKTEIARILYGLDDYQGEIRIKGQVIKIKTVRQALRSGFSLVPEERRADGIFGKLPIRINIPMMKMANVLSRGIISQRKEAALADKYIDKMSIVARDREQRVAFLSGGNQQKVVISKCLNKESDILIMDEPTRGVDVGAKTEIHNIIRSLANEGRGVLVFSSELQEIIHLCDRIVLMHEGQIREVLRNKEGLDTDHIMRVIAGEAAHK